MAKKKRCEIDFGKFKDEDLIQMVTEIKNATTNNKKVGTIGFSDYYHVDFDYNQATYELEQRGYEQGWVKKNSNGTFNNILTRTIDLSASKRTTTERYEATFSTELINKLRDLVKDIPKKDKKSIALELMLEPLVDEMIRDKKAGKLMIKDVQKKVIERNEFYY